MMALALGCARTEEVNVEDVADQKVVTITASFAESQTRTILPDGGPAVYWEPEDEIKMFCGAESSKFKSTLTEPAAVSGFSGTLPVIFGATEDTSADMNLLAIYPYSSDATSNGTSIITTLPDEQDARAGSFAKDLNLSMAQSNSFSMKFYNVCGGLCFKLTKSGIKEITFKSNNGESIAGKVELAFENGVPAIKKIVEGSDNITLTAPDDGTFATDVWYYIVSLPTTLSGGFKMTFRTDSESAVLNYSSQLTFKRRIFGRVADIDSGLTWDKRTHEEFKALALDVNHQTTNACGVHSSLSHLYDNATELMDNWSASSYYEKDADVYVAYNSTIDLKDILRIHVNPVSDDGIPDTSREDIYTLSELQTKYASLGLDFNFSLVEYTLGSNGTPESAYGIIDGYTFHPAHADLYGKPIMNSGAERDGISGVGRQPIVHVTLVGSDGDVYLSGYFKILITKDEPCHDAFIVKEFTVPYTGTSTVTATWLDCSFAGLETGLKMSKNEFKERFGCKWTGGESTTSLETFVLDSNGGFVNTVSLGDTAPQNVSTALGTFRYIGDATISTVSANDIFTVTFTQAQMDNINKYFGGKITLYGKFGSTHDYVYIGITVEIADKPVVNFVKLNPPYWFSTPDNTSTDIVFVNPRIPRGDPTFDNVKIYSRWLNSVWATNIVKTELDASSAAVYKSIWSTMPYAYHYELSSNQPKILGKQIAISSARDAFYLGNVDAANLLGTLDTHTIHTFNGTSYVDEEAVANASTTSLTADARTYGRITYTNTTETAKKTINSFPVPAFSATQEITDQNLSDMLYVNVDLVATYGPCNIPLESKTFHVAFFRPINIKSTGTKVKDGSIIKLGDIFRIQDWQGHTLFEWDSDANYDSDLNLTGAFVDNYTVVGQTPWRSYYGVSSIKVDIAATRTDVYGGWNYFSNYFSPSAKFYYGINNGSELEIVGYDTATDSYALTPVSLPSGGITDLKQLKSYAIHYKDNGAGLTYNLYIPITVTYKWGELTAYAIIRITQ